MKLQIYLANIFKLKTIENKLTYRSVRTGDIYNSLLQETNNMILIFTR